MKRIYVLFLGLICSAITMWADEVPTLLILTTNSEEVQIPIATIQKITYNQDQQNAMYVQTQTGTQTYLLDNVVKMTLADVPTPTAIPQLSDTQTNSLTKFLQNGVVYVVKDGKVYTLDGGQKQ